MDFGETAVETRPCLETVRALHQTVVALRSALEQSRTEILQLKQKAWPLESVENALKNLAIENHILRNTLASSTSSTENLHDPLQQLPSKPHTPTPVTNNDHNSSHSKLETKKSKPARRLLHVSISVEKPSHNSSRRRHSKSLEHLHSPKKHQDHLTKTVSFSDMTENARVKTTSQSSNSPRRPILTSSNTLPTSAYVVSSPNISSAEIGLSRNVLENAQSEPLLQNASSQNDLEQSEEVDDIELIFTTEDTNDSDFKEELVPIEDNGDKNLQCPPSDLDQSFSDRELDDDVFNETDDPQDMTQDAQTGDPRDTSQMCNSKSDNSINHEEKSLKSYYSYQDSSFENKSLEKDESFDRFEERIRIIETDISKCGIIDVEYVSGRRNTCPNPLPYRPIIHREAIGKGLNTRKGRPILTHSNNTRRESGAQTDISALPNSAWRSESSLAHKVKVGDHFTTLPSKFPLPGSRLRLSEKTNVEARRVLLSDIGFTSMVPELSRSADHLCPGGNNAMKISVPPTYGQFLKTTDLYSPACTSQKFNWTATTASPSEASQLHSRFGSFYPLLSPPAPSRRFSAPISPITKRMFIKPAMSKVRFANGSLPELRGEWGLTFDSGDSTDSLVEEAENYVRRSIDCITSQGEGRYSESRSHCFRRASAPEPAGDNVPPLNWQPFLPRAPRDLHLDHWVKVIVPEGRVRGGRVRYIGPILNQSEQYVGVQLSTPDGYSDGTYNNRRYFNCEPHHGIFVPFKKVVMGWRP